jgi:elongation factor Ts
MMDCKKALGECGGDVEKAKDWLRKKGLRKASDMSERHTAEGRVFAYLHHNKRIGVLLEAGCETDFVAANEDFQTLFQDICLHIAATPNCKYLTREEVPAELIERERDIYREEVKGKPENIQDKIIDGKLEAFFQSCVLLDQPFVKNDAVRVHEAIAELAGLLQENLVIRRFERFEVGL